MKTGILSAGLALGLSSLLPAVAWAEDSASPRPRTAADTPWEARLAYRGAYLESPGYAPFSNNDYFSQVSLEGSRVLLARGRFSFAAGLAWDYGTTGAAARAADTNLEVHRLTVPLTLRYALFRRLDVLATIAPGGAYQRASLLESSAPAPLVASSWVPAGDASLGLAWSFADAAPWGHPITFRVIGEGGYAWAGRMSLAMTPDLPAGDPRRTGATELGELAMNGGFWRLGVAAAF